MQNIKPLQTSKPKIMSNKEAMEELERYNPKEEIKEPLEEKIDVDFYNEAQDLYNNINSQIGKENKLYKWGIGDSGKFTYANACMAILAFLLGNKEEAIDLYKNINSQIKKENGLYNSEIGDSNKRTKANTLMGILCCLLSGKEFPINNAKSQPLSGITGYGESGDWGTA